MTERSKQHRTCSTGLPVLSSGKPFPKNSYNGLPIFPPGVEALALALVELEPHPLEKDQPFGRPLYELDLVPPFALELVAAKIDELRKSRKLKHRPRLAEIKQMAIEAMQTDRSFQSELDAIFRGPQR